MQKLGKVEVFFSPGSGSKDRGNGKVIIPHQYPKSRDAVLLL